MDLVRLRYFLAVARTGGVTAAAREHFVTQPAVSLGLKTLEKEIGVRLFERRGGRMTLTAAGERFAAAASQALRRLEEGRRAAARAADTPSGPLVIGATDVASLHLLPAVLPGFHRAYPDVEVGILVDSSRPLVESVAQESLDLALVTLPVDHPDLVVVPLRRDAMALVLPPNHPLARGRLRARDLQGQPFLLYRRGSKTRAFLDRELAARRIAPRVVMETGHPEVMKRLVATGLGMSILPAVSVAEEARARVLAVRALPGGPLVRATGLVRRRDREPSPAARAFLDLLARVFPKPARYPERRRPPQAARRALTAAAAPSSPRISRR
jgi:DNA-binding transcriptional LysR family regulator